MYRVGPRQPPLTLYRGGLIYWPMWRRSQPAAQHTLISLPPPGITRSYNDHAPPSEKETCELCAHNNLPVWFPPICTLHKYSMCPY